MNLQGACGGNGNLHIQDHRNIRSHHETIVTAGRQFHNQGIVRYLLFIHLKFISPQGNIRVFAIFPGSIFYTYRCIDVSQIQGDGIFRNFQRKRFVRIFQKYGNVPQGEISVIVITVIQRFYRVCGAAIRLYPAGSWNFVTRGHPDRQDGTYQKDGQYQRTHFPQYFFHVISSPAHWPCVCFNVYIIG